MSNGKGNPLSFLLNPLLLISGILTFLAVILIDSQISPPLDKPSIGVLFGICYALTWTIQRIFFKPAKKIEEDPGDES